MRTTPHRRLKITRFVESVLRRTSRWQNGTRFQRFCENARV